MSVWQLLGLVLIAGGVGGLANSLISDKGFNLPHTIAKGDGTSILIPGFIGNLLIGAVAAGVSWLLYGPLSQTNLTNLPTNITMEIAVLGGAVMVGMSGSGWLTSAIDKNVLRSAAAQAAGASADPIIAQKMLVASPADVLRLAQNITNNGSTLSTAASLPATPVFTDPSLVTTPPAIK